MRIRKITALATAAVMTVSSVLPVWAENPWGGAESTPTAYSDVNVSEDGFRYEVMGDGNIRITGKPSHTDEEKKIIIPGEIDGKKVTEIGSGAFGWGFNYVEEFILPDSLVKIGHQAFSGCGRLQKITIPEGVTEIDDYGFHSCGCLRDISLPKSLKKIGREAFRGCDSLEEIVIPEGVTELGYGAFGGSAKLKKVKISKGLETMDDAFDYCNNLEEIEVDGDNCYFASEAGVLFNKEKTVLIKYPVKKANVKYEIPESVEKINDDAFEYCGILEEITMSENVKEIGWYAFGCCKKLKEIKLSDNIENIERTAFEGCSSLQKIEIPKKMTALESDLFLKCEKLETVIMHEGITDIGYRTFSGCRSLQEITIPAGVTSIGDEAFSGCRSLQEITIPAGVTNIGDSAFSYCESLQEIIIPEGVTSIGWWVFYNCENLKKIYIPKSIEDMETSAIGYMDGQEENSVKTDVTIYGYKGTAAETYAQENDLNFIAVMEAGDTDIKLEYNSDLIDGIVPEGTVKLDAKELQDTDAEYEKISIENLIKDETIDISAVKLTAYEIRLTDGDNKPVQPSGSITVKIPCPEGYDGNVCKVYYIDGEGKATDMGAVYENGYMVFETDHFSTYIVTETELKETVSVISGDANGDGEVDIKDAVMLKKHLAGYPDLKINLTAADTTGDGEVNINDAVRLLRYLAGDTVTLGK